MSNGSALDRVMDQAASAASNYQAPALTGQQGGALQTASTGNAMARPSMASFMESAGIQVDEFLTVKEAGFRLSDMKGYFKEALVELDLSDVVPIYQVRGTTGGNTRFIKSYDGVSTPQGQNFQLAEQQLRATSDKVDGPYPTAEIPVTLLQDVTDGKVTVKAGTTVGITPSMTGFNHFTKFVSQLAKVGRENDKVTAKITHTQRTNRNGNEWGVVDFELAE